MSYSDIRRTGVVGIIERSDLDDTSSLHFSEWWNAEGLDFHFDQGTKREARISLSVNQLEMLATAALAAGFLDLDAVEEQAEELKRASRKKMRKIQEIVENHE